MIEIEEEAPDECDTMQRALNSNSWLSRLSRRGNGSDEPP